MPIFCTSAYRQSVATIWITWHWERDMRVAELPDGRVIRAKKAEDLYQRAQAALRESNPEPLQGLLWREDKQRSSRRGR